jgi:hypothetical protein
VDVAQYSGIDPSRIKNVGSVLKHLSPCWHFIHRQWNLFYRPPSEPWTIITRRKSQQKVD